MSALRLLLVSAPYYPSLTKGLEASAIASLRARRAKYDIVHVSGVLEIPTAIRLASKTASAYDGYIALGVVIRGATAHFDIVAQQSAAGLMQLGVGAGLAIGNGILTVETLAQAQARLNKGAEAALACLSLLALQTRLSS